MCQSQTTNRDHVVKSGLDTKMIHSQDCYARTLVKYGNELTVGKEGQDWSKHITCPARRLTMAHTKDLHTLRLFGLRLGVTASSSTPRQILHSHFPVLVPKLPTRSSRVNRYKMHVNVPFRVSQEFVRGDSAENAARSVRAVIAWEGVSRAASPECLKSSRYLVRDVYALRLSELGQFELLIQCISPFRDGLEVLIRL